MSSADGRKTEVLDSGILDRDVLIGVKIGSIFVFGKLDFLKIVDAIPHSPFKRGKTVM